MDQFEVLSHFRRRIGNPKKEETNDTTLLAFLEPHLLWLADELEYKIITEALAIALSEDEYRYALPEGALYLMWVEWNGARLTPGSTAAWVRENTDWRGATAALPTTYAVEGREILLSPPPSGDALDDDSFLMMSWVAEGELGPAGVAGLTDSDLWVAIYRASVDWLGMNPGRTQEELAESSKQGQVNSQLFEAALRPAKQRRARPVKRRSQRWRLRAYPGAAR